MSKYMMPNLYQLHLDKHMGTCMRCGIEIDENEIYCKECSDELESECFIAD